MFRRLKLQKSENGNIEFTCTVRPVLPLHRFRKSILKFKDSMKRILSNRNFVLLLVSYGFINGTFYAFIILAGIWFYIIFII